MTAAHIKNVALAVAVAICGSCDSRNTVDQRSAPPAQAYNGCIDHIAWDNNHKSATDYTDLTD